ncbi:hypothetical protein IWW45_005356 [Coemansia sp. RSA 485]|nr:hypothetical protein IWW45_005356 [Coemansia sp. RSA 485]
MAPSVFPLNKAYIGNLETLEIDLQSVGYYSNDTEDMEAWLKDNFRSKNPIYQTLNLLLEKIKPQSSSKLRIEDDNEGFVLDSSRINWIYLKHLDLCCPIGFVSLLELLKKYVYLEYLSVERIDLGEPNEIVTDVSELSAPLNSTLSTLCLPFACAVNDFPFLLVVGLVLRLVGLKVLRVPHNVCDDVVSAVKVYQGSYAHLSKLVIKSVD